MRVSVAAFLLSLAVVTCGSPSSPEKSSEDVSSPCEVSTDCPPGQTCQGEKCMEPATLPPLGGN